MMGRDLTYFTIWVIFDTLGLDGTHEFPGFFSDEIMVFVCCAGEKGV
jgi:hypothetical protein